MFKFDISSFANDSKWNILTIKGIRVGDGEGHITTVKSIKIMMGVKIMKTISNQFSEMMSECYGHSEREISELTAEENLKLDPTELSSVRQFYFTFYHSHCEDGFGPPIKYFITEEELKTYLIENKRFGIDFYREDIWAEKVEDDSEEEAERTARNIIEWTNSKNICWIVEGYYVLLKGSPSEYNYIWRIDEAYSSIIRDMHDEEIAFEEMGDDYICTWYLSDPTDKDIDGVMKENMRE